VIVIFLDIDGVLNSLRSATAWDNVEVPTNTKNYNAEVTKTTIDPVSVQLVNKLVEDSGAKIVVSSSHRLMFMKKYGYGEIPVLDLIGLRDYLHHIGLVAEIIDATVDYYFNRRDQGCVRGDEIKMWLDAHKDVENYVILDDDADMLHDQLPHFVHTSTIDGFRFEHYCKAREILKLEAVSASVNTLCRTDQEYYAAAAYENDGLVRLPGFRSWRSRAYRRCHHLRRWFRNGSGSRHQSRNGRCCTRSRSASSQRRC
jgi:hypothetical protein